MNRQTDRQTDSQTERQTDRQTPVRRTDERIAIRTNRQTDRRKKTKGPKILSNDIRYLQIVIISGVTPLCPGRPLASGPEAVTPLVICGSTDVRSQCGAADETEGVNTEV